jgi:type VI secretion system protein ImpG
MELDAALYKAFLGELQALERFRITYSGLHPEVGLERDDPDVRRLVEAMALLTARSRLAGRRAASRTATRLFVQQLPYMLTPTPAVALVQAQPQPGFVQAELLEAGEGLLFDMDGEGGTAAEALFRTLSPLQVLPIELSGVRTVREESGRRMLYLDFHSRYRRSWQVSALSLLVDHLSDLRSSATLFHALQSHLTHATVSFDERVMDGPGARKVPVTFGAPPSERPGNTLVEHPLQRARLFFRLPQQHMFMRFELPTPEAEWQDFTLCLELGPGWPRGLAMTADSFKLNVVPAVNLSRELSDPVDCDGSLDRYRVRHPEVSGGFEPHSVVGAYRLDAADGLVPLLPAAIPRPGARRGSEPGTYEVEYEQHERGRRAWLLLDLRDALEQPVQVSADTFWHQPALTQERLPPAEIRPADRNLERVAWRVVGSLAAAVRSPVEDDDEALLELVALKSQPALDRDGLVMVLELLRGTEPVFAEVVRSIEGVEVRTAPYARAAAGMKVVYSVRLGVIDAALLPVVALMGPRLRDVLHAWSTQEVVELELELPALEQRLSYRHAPGGLA